ncbi:hypothetical protein LRAMOSA05328 [Lichtheimia ramosa]|uniref:Uncharacterized protein n=1 Tax=Lichtheimia ramosa TaxID=688394 RepID=A0A077X0N9_9FUNG|nr:hypothetical protein LRAMOSA05328 [Lichtheimia ramosa]
MGKSSFVLINVTQRANIKATSILDNLDISNRDQQFFDMANSDPLKWSQVAAKGAGMRVISPTRIFDSNARLSSQILFEDPEFQNQQLARKAASIVRQALTPQSVLFSFPPTLFAHRTEAYKSIEDNIGPLAAVRPLSLYSIQSRGDLLIEAKFASHAHATKAIQKNPQTIGIHPQETWQTCYSLALETHCSASHQQIIIVCP